MNARFSTWAYRRQNLAGDLIAGAVTASLLVPQSLADALLAGLPAQAGLFAAMAPALVYAVFGSSRPLSVGPVAVVSLMTATALAPIATPGSVEYVQAALVLTLLSGLMLLLLGSLRLGVLVNFLSYPVLGGFTMGAATLILLSQLPQVFGLKLQAHDGAASQMLRLIEALPNTAALPLLFGSLSILGLILARGPLAGGLQRLGVPAGLALGLSRAMPLLLVIGASLTVAASGLHQSSLQLVGPLIAGLPAIQWPDLPLARWQSLLAPAALIGLIGYVEGMSVAQILARRKREKLRANRELIAIGLANVAAALTQGMPVAGSLSRSVVLDAAGARTRLAGALASMLVIVAAMTFTWLLETLPRVVLAAIIIVSVLRLLDFSALIRIWKYDRADGLAWIATTLGVLTVGVEAGLVAGLGVSLLLYIWRTANPHISEVGRLPHSDTFIEADRHHELELWPQLLLIRIDESLFFGNAAAVEAYIANKVAGRAEVTDVILICSAVNAIDISALESLESLLEALAEAGVTLHLAELKGKVMDRLADSGFLDRLDARRIHVSTAAAIISLASPPI